MTSQTYPDGTPLAPGDSLEDNPQGGWGPTDNGEDYTDFTAFKDEMVRRKLTWAPKYSDYPGDDGDLHSEVLNEDGDTVGVWGPTEPGGFGGVLFETAAEWYQWVNTWGPE